MNGQKLFKSNANHLQKVYEAVKSSQKMNGSQVILGTTNQKVLLEAEKKIAEAIQLLNSIS